MSRNGLYAIIAILLVAVVAGGIYWYQQEQAEPALRINVDENGLSVEGNG